MKCTNRLTVGCSFGIVFLLFMSLPAAAQISADFKATPESGYPPLTVMFEDKSSGGIIEVWLWSFPGGSPSAATGAGPHYVTYHSVGVYDVELTAQGPIPMVGGPRPSDTEIKSNYIEVLAIDRDFGDAPDSESIMQYPTLAAHDGAYHKVSEAIYLGSGMPDAERDGLPNGEAEGDDTDNEDDEDGIIIPYLVPEETIDLDIITHGEGYLSGWIDWNQNNDWEESGEKVLDRMFFNTDGTHQISLDVPGEAVVGRTFARFRFNSVDRILHSDNWGDDGEVEDYQVQVVDGFYLDSLACVALYNSTNGPGWTGQTNWLSGHLNTWEGITVSNGRVTAIDLESNNLAGPLPDEIGFLTRLTRLDLYQNDINGPIPPAVGDLERLEYLNLINNQVSGPIPTEIGNLSHLSFLNLYGNQLTSVPATIASLTSLDSLSLGANPLGTIPSEIGYLSNLVYLDLRDAGLTFLPAAIGDLTNLNKLTLEFNQLTGLPNEMANLVNLEVIFCNNNQFYTFPPVICDITSLVEFDFSFNMLTSIPPDIQNLTSLGIASLTDNQITSIPTEMCTILSLHLISLCDNQLTSVPPEIGNLINLTILNLRRNQIIALPSTIGNLTNMEYLYLDENLLSSIPTELSTMASLRFLHLNDNQISGPFPAGIIDGMGDLSNLQLQNNQLSGAFPDVCNCVSLRYLYLHDNEIEDLPDMSCLANLREVRVYNNRLTFEDIEPNLPIVPYPSWFQYVPQDSVGEEQDTTIAVFSDLSLYVSVGGSANQYRWLFNNGWMSGPSSGATFTLHNALPKDAGDYNCEVTSDIVPDLTIYRRYTHVTVGNTDVDESGSTIPETFELMQNCPNPFNPVTEIAYHLPEPVYVSLRIYNTRGQEICTLVNEDQEAGEKTVRWNGLDGDGKQMPSGIYIYRITAGEFNMVRKMILVQ